MKAFVAIFFSSTAFGVAILVAYFIVAHQETTGTALLAIMAAALAFAATYAVVAERNADLDGDGEDLTYRDRSGEDLGVFTTHSAWPILVAIAGALTIAGVMWSPLLAAISLLGLILCLWRLGAESART